MIGKIAKCTSVTCDYPCEEGTVRILTGLLAAGRGVAKRWYTQIDGIRRLRLHSVKLRAEPEALFCCGAGFSAIRLGAAAVANSVTFKRIEAKGVHCGIHPIPPYPNPTISYPALHCGAIRSRHMLMMMTSEGDKTGIGVGVK